MNYLFKKYRKFTFKRDKFISSVIDDEIKKTKEFGLNIDREDIEYEKLVFIGVFEHLWDKIENSGSNFTSLRLIASRIINEKLSNLSKKYFDISVKENLDVKNMYNCHIDECMSKLFLKISNKLYD